MNTREILMDILDSGIKEFDFDLDKFISNSVDAFFKRAKLGFPYSLFKGNIKNKLKKAILEYYNELKKGNKNK